MQKIYALIFTVVAIAYLPFIASAQQDTTQKKSLEKYLLTRKGLFGKLTKVLITDTTKENTVEGLQRNDIRFQPYGGKVIRHIEYKRLNFGTPISDTLPEVSTPLTRLSNKIHAKTHERVIKNNLFFGKNDVVQPYLLADNETYLRNLPYLQDAKISVINIPGNPDSVDIIVLTKDVLSIGGEAPNVDPKNTTIKIKEENFHGSGNRITLNGFFDQSRRKKYGIGAEYIKRNIAGSFLDAYFGYQSFNGSIYGNREEKAYYVKLVRPLVNAYLRWTYALDVSRHQTKNMYSGDSLYLSDYRYSYNNVDAWGGLNVNASFLDRYVRGQRLRGLIALRFLSQKFDALPLRQLTTYDPSYADITGVLSSISVFARDFYKTQYIYGFGRNEDIPEGIDIGLTAGFTRKQNKSRPYMGIRFERYYFTSHQRYLDFTVRLEGSLYKKDFEDVTALANVDFFNRLKTLGKWKQRTFLSAGITWQFNNVLNEPLFLQSKYGLPEFGYANIPGYIRTTVKGESVFYSPLSLASFRFAPFVFYNASLFTARNTTFANSKLYTSIGGGLRMRNESLIFGTVELRGYYFPTKNFSNQNFKIELNTNVRFKYNSQLAGRPDFIQVN